MLKLVRTSQDGQISVMVRHKEFLFGRSIMTAFIIALGIHASLLVLFHVAPFKISMTNSIFPPVRVETDIIVQEAAASAQKEPAIQAIHGIPLPAPSHPILAKHPQFSPVHPSEYIHPSSPKENPFTQIEADVFQPEIAIPLRVPKHPIEIVVSGLLANKILVSNGFDQNTLKPLSTKKITQDLRVVYDVRLEGRTGKIYWFEPKELSGNTPTDLIAEKIIRNMTFAVDNTTFDTSGEIELHFYPGAL